MTHLFHSRSLCGLETQNELSSQSLKLTSLLQYMDVCQSEFSAQFDTVTNRPYRHKKSDLIVRGVYPYDVLYIYAIKCTERKNKRRALHALRL